MDIMQFWLHGKRFMLVGDVMAYNGHLHAEPMDTDTDTALLELANERIAEWRAVMKATGNGLRRDAQRSILEQP